MRKMSDNSIYFIISSPQRCRDVSHWTLFSSPHVCWITLLSFFAGECDEPTHCDLLDDCRFRFIFSAFLLFERKSQKKWEISCVKNPIIRLKLKLFCQQILDLESSIKFTESESSSSLTLLQLKSQHLFVGRRRILMPLLLLLLSSFWHEEAMFTHSTPPLILLLLPYIFFSFNSCSSPLHKTWTS